MEIFLLDAFKWTDLVQPQWYVEHGGLWLLLFVVFAETGLFVGFFLPGDSLLFVAGMYAHEIPEDGKKLPGLGTQVLDIFGLGSISTPIIDLVVLLALISLCGILGNMVGYWTGRKIGPAMYNWRDRFLFKKKYLYQAHEFYQKHGGVAVIGARFLPIIRTFAPIVAGIVKMDRKKFYFFNIIGCVTWVFSMLFGGYFLQKWVWQLFHFDLKEHLELIVLGIVLITTAPVLVKMFSRIKQVPGDISTNDSMPD
jgi:membrane-associated protein